MSTYNREEMSTMVIKAFQDFTDFVEAQGKDMFNKELIKGKWPISHHQYHLIKSTRALNKGMAMPKLGMRTMFGKSNRQERTFEETRDKYKNAVAMPQVKAPSNFEAEAGRAFTIEELHNRFQDELQSMLKHLQKWSEKDLSEYILPHPAIGKCTLREMIYWTVVHTDHHRELLINKYLPAYQGEG